MKVLKSKFLFFLLSVVFLGSVPESHVYRYDVHHSGVYRGDKIPGLDRLKWKFKTNGTIYSSPAVVNQTIYFGSNDRNFYQANQNKFCHRDKRAMNELPFEHGISK